MTTRRTRVEADLGFSVDLDGRDRVSGRLTGSGSDLTLSVSDPAAFAGSGDAAALRGLARELADLGLKVRVTDHEDVVLLRMGDVRAPWWQRVVTRSPHLRVAGVRGALAGGRGRARGQGATLAPPRLTPPPTPYPPAPTFLRRPVKRVTTTHDPGRGGGPRLVEAPSDDVTRSAHPVHWLQQDVTVVGSDADCDLVLSGLEGRHAEVVHDDADEYRVRALAPLVRLHGEPVAPGELRLLRTSARLQLGPRTLTFVREEYADHGRPYGGRIGGEAGRQLPQPPRPDASRSRPDTT